LLPALREASWPVLFPLALVWGYVTHWRRKLVAPRAPERVRGKVIVVGNVHSGGSGKTPLVAAIAERFSDRQPVLVLRGYRGELSHAGARVQEGPGGPSRYGDEAWMLHRRTGQPVYIGRRRGEALAKAQAETGAQLFLLDDGFQNFSFRHAIDLVAVSTERAVEAYCLPLGDLREPLAALGTAAAVVLTGSPTATHRADWKAFLSREFPALPVFEATAEIEGIWGRGGAAASTGNLAWGAFAGIAHPERFAAAAKSAVDAHFVEVFADHHPYTAEDIQNLLRLRKRHGTHHFLTTEKDWHKAAPLFEEAQQELFYLRIRYVLPESFWYFLQSHLETA